MPMTMIEHYNQHKKLGTASTVDRLPILLPKLTQLEIDELANLENPDGGPYLESGMILYNTDTDTVQFYNGSLWTSL